jgi:hypothetical protein
MAQIMDAGLILKIQLHYLSGTNIMVPEEEELMTVNIDSSTRSRARLHRMPDHSSSVHRDHGSCLKLMSGGWLRLARRLGTDSASPDVYTLLLHNYARR